MKYLLSVILFLLVSAGVILSQEEIRYIGSVAWSPTNQLVVSAPSGLGIYTEAEMSVVNLCESMISNCNVPADNPTFSPDGLLLAYTTFLDTDTVEVVVQSINEKREMFSFPLQAIAGTDIKFNGDGSLLAAVERLDAGGPDTVNQVQIWRVADQQLIRTIDFGIENGGTLSWGNTIDTLWMLGGDNNGVFSYLRAINVNTGERVVDIRQSYNFFFGGLPTINNRWVIFWTFIDAPEVPGFMIYRLDATMPDPQPYHIIPYDQSFSALTITEQGNRMAFATDDKSFAIFDVLSQQIIEEGQTNESIRKLSFSPDGTLLAITTYSQPRQVQDFEVWNVATMQRIYTASLPSIANTPTPTATATNTPTPTETATNTP